MKKIKNLLIVIAAMLVILSCSEGADLSISESGYTGKWDWISTTGGFAAHINETPQSSGKTVQLILTGDEKFRVIENDKEIAAGTYEVTMENSIYSESMESFIHLSENVPARNVVFNGIIRIENDSLLSISDNHYDGIGSTFKRVN